jgi:hypothetical protein
MDRRYPAGPFTFADPLAPARRAECIDEIAALPAKARAAVESLPAGAIDKPYRDGGWTGRQVVHHLADSHMNSYVRFRLALTEDNPTIKPYDESLWAELSDARGAEVEVSLALLDALHRRWAALLRSLTGEQWSRRFVHPEVGPRDLNWMVQLYAWHSRHHLGHLALLRDSAG